MPSEESAKSVRPPFAGAADCRASRVAEPSASRSAAGSFVAPTSSSSRLLHDARAVRFRTLARSPGPAADGSAGDARGGRVPNCVSPLGNLGPGDYVIELNAKAGDEAAQQFVAFRVVRTGPRRGIGSKIEVCGCARSSPPAPQSCLFSARLVRRSSSNSSNSHSRRRSPRSSRRLRIPARSSRRRCSAPASTTCASTRSSRTRPATRSAICRRPTSTCRKTASRRRSTPSS